MLLKRIVALEHDTVAFRDGRLLVNQQEVKEPHVSGPCDWNLSPRQVKPGHVYVVGIIAACPWRCTISGKLLSAASSSSVMVNSRTILIAAAIAVAGIILFAPAGQQR